MADGDYINRNICKTLNIASVGTSAFVACGAQICSEATIVASAAVLIKASSDSGTAAEMRVPADTPVTFRGLTNADQLSAKSTSGTITVYVRTQYFSVSVVTG